MSIDITKVFKRKSGSQKVNPKIKRERNGASGWLEIEGQSGRIEVFAHFNTQAYYLRDEFRALVEADRIESEKLRRLERSHVAPVAVDESWPRLLARGLIPQRTEAVRRDRRNKPIECSPAFPGRMVPVWP